MFTYYGSKLSLAYLYPQPKHDLIIEPFAGSARYSLLHWDRDVLLVDKYDVIIKIWKWLQQCSPSDIIGLPRLKFREKLSDYTFDCDEARLFMGFLVAKAVATPRNSASIFATELRPNHINYQLRETAKNLHKIRHWKFECKSYSDIENQDATWFIDPPYIKGGEHYKYSSKRIDYGDLSEWCKTRSGQAIVCENMPATWLPFEPMKRNKGATNNYTTEAIWTNDGSQPIRQLSMF